VVRSRIQVAALAGASIGGLEATASFVVFPEIRDTIAGGNGSAASWTLTIAGIVGAAVLLQAGRLADRFGHERLFRTGVTGFTVFSVVAASSPTLLVLIAARAAQALSLAVMSPSSLALILRDVPRGQHSRTIGLWGAITAIAGVVGAPLAGVLVGLGSWRASFVVFALLAGAIAAMAWSAPHEQRTRVKGPPIDVFGAGTIVVGLGLLVLVLVEGNDWGWLSPRTLIVALVAVGLIGVAVRRSMGQADPVIPLDLLRDRNMAMACGLSLTTAIGFFAHWLVVLSLLTDLWDLSLLWAALAASVMPLTMAILAVPAGRAIDRFDFRNVMMPGAITYAVLFSIPALLLDESRNWWVLMPALIGAGIGMGLVWPPLTGAGTSHVQPERLATATALIHTFQRIGGSLGSAIAVAWIASGTPGAVATYRDPIWMLVIVGVIAAIGSSMLRRDNVTADQEAHPTHTF
jgi:EmrB/QacA subfamily drug resistance transporter